MRAAGLIRVFCVTIGANDQYIFARAYWTDTADVFLFPQRMAVCTSVYESVTFATLTFVTLPDLPRPWHYWHDIIRVEVEGEYFWSL